MYTDNPNHGPALYMMNNGTLTPNRPSSAPGCPMAWARRTRTCRASWCCAPVGRVRFAELWSSGFLPGEHQGTYINHSNLDPQQMIPFLSNPKHQAGRAAPATRPAAQLNEQHDAERGGDPNLEARIRSMETAYRMQIEAQDAFDMQPRNRARSAIVMAAATSRTAACSPGAWPSAACASRRSTTATASRGTRTRITRRRREPVQGHRPADRRTAHDLKQRGLLDDTLVIWGGEFGRTPTSENGGWPRPQPVGLHDVDGRRRRQRRHDARRHRRVRLPLRRTRSAFTTCTRRSCICWASITRSSPIAMPAAIFG